MKSMGTSPPRNKENEKIKRQIYAEQCDKLKKEQLEASPIKEDEPRLMDCCGCGEPFQMGKGFVHDGKFEIWWCEQCFREMAKRVYGEI